MPLVSAMPFVNWIPFVKFNPLVRLIPFANVKPLGKLRPLATIMPLYAANAWSTSPTESSRSRASSVHPHASSAAIQVDRRDRLLLMSSLQGSEVDQEAYRACS